MSTDDQKDQSWEDKECCAKINIYCGEKKPHPEPHDCKCGESCEFAQVFSLVPQTLSPSPSSNQPGQNVLFENTVYHTANIDVSNAASSGKITVNKAGWYDVTMGMCGTLNPIPAPLPVWTLSLFLNGALVPGSTFANIPISPVQGSNEISSDVFVHFNAGDVVELANTTIYPVFLTAETLGSNVQTSSASLKLSMLKAD